MKIGPCDARRNPHDNRRMAAFLPVCQPARCEPIRVHSCPLVVFLLHGCGITTARLRVSGFRLGSVTEGLAGLFHLGLKGLARRLPGLLLERDFATALAFAGVLPGIFAAAALAFARVFTLAGMFIRQRTVAH